MLVSGGQILAIDHVVRNDTLVGDGSTKPLGVNTDVIATTALVSATSAKLQDEIDAVSSNFDNYYTKNETSAASEISAALEGVIRHETEVSAADNTIDVSSETLPDGTVVYKIKASSNTNIIGVDPISAELREDGSWYITYHGSQGNIYNKGPNIDIYQVDDQWYISAAVPDVSNFLTSAVGHEGKALVLKDNVWVPADYVTDDDIQNLSATIANTYVSASIFNTYSASVKDKLDELTDVTDVVKETSAKWDEASAFAAHSADFMLSAKLNTFEKDGRSYISGYDNSPFFDKDTLYTGSEGIKVDIDTHEISISAKYLSANSLDDLSGKWESVYDTIDTNSAAWNAHSALSATKLDASESAKFMKIADLQSAPENTISGYGESAFYYPPFPEITEYSGKDGIKVENYEISISANYLSANALDELSGKWEDTANTVSTASGSWNEASAFGANSGKFVTSAGFEFENDLAYFLKKQEDESMAWSGVDLSDLGKIYPISSLTPNLISATVSSVDGTPTYVLSAASANEYNAPMMNGEGLYASYNASYDRYDIQLGINGHNGISAEYDNANNKWDIGISANDYSYLAGLYDKQAVLIAGDIIKYDSNNTQHIEIDEDGYFTLPDTGNKFTFCINESIENNTTTSHDYKLNKIALVKVDTQTNAEEVIVTTNNYYPSEVGASDANITFTLSHLPNYKYAVKYLGSDIPVTANLVSKISIIEEITSLATTEGGDRTYGGVEPIWVDNDAYLVGLAYDRSQFKVVTGADIAHPKLSALQIDIQTTGGNIDQAAFEKMANLVYGRLTETIPIGLVNSHELLGNGGAFSYLFRPTMEFDVSSGTVARIMTLNGTVGNSKAQVAISELNESNANVTIMWWSEIKALTAAAGTLALSANPSCTENRTLYPDRLYYASVINRDQQTQYVGFKNEFLTDAGAYDIAYWDEHAKNNDHFAGDLPGSLSGIAASKLGQTGNARLKPYIAFRNEV